MMAIIKNQQALNRGADAIFEVMMGEYQGDRKSDSKGFPFSIIPLLIIVLIILLIAISKHRRGGGRNGGRKSGSFSILDAIILSNMGRSSGSGFGSSSGGGFGGSGFGGGFGGGGFGGGGASGGW